MKTINDIFKAEKTGFIPYLTFADPDRATTKELLKALQSQKVDLIEIGIAFSDPVADGEVNRRSSERSLQSGGGLTDCLSLLEELQDEGFHTPVVLFGYLNPFLQFGVEKLAAKAAPLGVAGVLIVDLPIESSGEMRKTLREKGVELIALVSPTTSAERLRLIGEQAGGFVYCVSRPGTTGKNTDFDREFFAYLERVKNHVRLPLVVGFGVSRPEQVRELKGRCQAVVVGSVIVREIEQNLNQKEKIIPAVRKLVSELMQPLEVENVKL